MTTFIIKQNKKNINIEIRFDLVGIQNFNKFMFSLKNKQPNIYIVIKSYMC